jgi:phosphoenolpyruvate synthase/pyruvate phosphate dikinase
MSADSPHILWFEKVGHGDVGSVGGKNASLAEVVAKFGNQGVDSIPVSPGSFVAVMPPEHAQARGKAVA